MVVVWSVPWVGLVLRNTQVGRPFPPPLAYPEFTSLLCPPTPRVPCSQHTHTHPTSLPVRVLLVVCVPSLPCASLFSSDSPLPPIPLARSPPPSPRVSVPPPLSLLSCPCPCPGCGSVVCDRAPPKPTPTPIETSIGSKHSGVRPPATRNPTPIAMTERTAESPPRHTAEPHRPTQMRRVRRSCAVLDGRVGWGDQRGGAWGTK